MMIGVAFHTFGRHSLTGYDKGKHLNGESLMSQLKKGKRNTCTSKALKSHHTA